MNIIIHELKRNKFMLCAYSLGIMFLIFTAFMKFDASNPESVDALNTVLSQMPRSLQVIFSLDYNLNVAYFNDYFLMMYSDLILVAAIFAINIGVTIVNDEVSDNTFEFIYTKPLSKRKILLKKWISGIILNVIYTLATVVVTLILMKSNDTANYGEMIKIYLLQFTTQLVFYNIGFGLNVIPYKRKITGYANIIVALTFILKLTSDLFSLDFLNYLNPIQYFDSVAILRGDGLNYGYVIMALFVLTLPFLNVLYSNPKHDIELN